MADNNSNNKPTKSQKCAKILSIFIILLFITAGAIAVAIVAIKYMKNSPDCAKVFRGRDYIDAIGEICNEDEVSLNFASLELPKNSFLLVFSDSNRSSDPYVIYQDVPDIVSIPFQIRSALVLSSACFYYFPVSYGSYYEHCSKSLVDWDSPIAIVATGANSLYVKTDEELLINPFTVVDLDKHINFFKQVHALPNNCIRLYYDKKFEGSYLETCQIESWVGDRHNDEFSSILVPSGTTVRLFQHITFDGLSVELTSSYADLNDVLFDNMLSSLQVVKKGCVVLFEHCDYLGFQFVACKSEVLAKEYRDKISGVVTFDKGVKLYDGAFEGRMLEVLPNTNVNCLVKHEMNDQVVSLIIDD